jgi:hypothetical protein
MRGYFIILQYLSSHFRNDESLHTPAFKFLKARNDDDMNSRTIHIHKVNNMNVICQVKCNGVPPLLCSTLHQHT